MVNITDTHGYTLNQLKELEQQATQIRRRLRYMEIRLVWEGYPATCWR